MRIGSEPRPIDFPTDWCSVLYKSATLICSAGSLMLLLGPRLFLLSMLFFSTPLFLVRLDFDSCLRSNLMLVGLSRKGQAVLGAIVC